MADTFYQYMNFLLEYKKDAEITDGCTDQEVDEIERKLNVKFPRAYRELYLIFGAVRAFGVVQANEFVFPDFEGMRTAAKRFAESGGSTLDFNDNIFVLSCFKQNGIFAYFRLDEGDDPPVYEYTCGEEEEEMAALSFSDFVRESSWYEGYQLSKNKRKG